MSTTDNNKDLPLPEQHKGGEKNIESTVDTGSLDEASNLFQRARKRLFDVNNWDKICGKLSAVFKLTDNKGNEVSGEAKEGNYFKIDIPGPGTAAGKGYDWVRVEEIVEENKGETEYALIRVRPTDNPSTGDKSVAHFFSDKATSNFVIKRDGTFVTAAVYGRNEVPNTEADNLLDKARNAVIGVSAIAGVSNAQWKSLTNGLLYYNEK